MKRGLIIGAAAAGAGLCARRAACGRSGCDFERLVERMPENAPPKWMYRNIGAIRANTERILDLLEAERAPAAGEHEPTSVA